MTRKVVSKKRGVQKKAPPNHYVAFTQKLPATLCGVAMQPHEWAILFSVVIFGAWLRLWNLSGWAIGGDDAIHILISFRKDAWDTLLYATKYETHPPLKYLLLYWLIKYISPAQDVLRLIGVIPGVLLMPAMYLLGRITMGRMAGLLLLLATTLSPTAIIQSENVRAYSVCQLALVVALAAAWLYLKQPTAQRLWLYFGGMTLALLTQYVAILPAAGLGASLLLILWQKHRRITPTMKLIAVGHVALFLLWALQVGTYLHFRGHFMPKDIGYITQGFITDIKSFGSILAMVTSGFLMMPKNPLYYPFIVVFVAGIVVMLREKQHTFLMWIAAVLVLAIIAAVAQKYPMIHIRHGMWLMLFTYLPVAYLAEWATRRFKPAENARYVVGGIIVLLAFSNALFYDPRFASPDYYRLGAYYKGAFAEQEVRYADFMGALKFLEARVDVEKDVVVMGLADGLRMDYYTRVYKKPHVRNMLKARLQCRSWNNYNAKQLKNCIYRLWEIYPDFRKSEKETRDEIARLQRAREVYIMTGYNKDLVASKQFIDWLKPTYISPTLAVFSASPELRGHFMNPPPNRPGPLPIP